MTAVRCACGRALHYSDPAIEACVQQAITAFGAIVAVPASAGT